MRTGSVRDFERGKVEEDKLEKSEPDKNRLERVLSERRIRQVSCD